MQIWKMKPRCCSIGGWEPGMRLPLGLWHRDVEF